MNDVCTPRIEDPQNDSYPRSARLDGREERNKFLEVLEIINECIEFFEAGMSDNAFERLDNIAKKYQDDVRTIQKRNEQNEANTTV